MENIQALCQTIAQRYNRKIEPLHQIVNGDECTIWLVTSDNTPLIVRISPPQRSLAQLNWTHRLMLTLHTRFPVVVAPLRATDGSTLFLHNGSPTTLFPFIDGHTLDRENSAQRHEAATLLARLHNAALELSTLAGQSPSSDTNASFPTVPDPDILNDPELDAWHAQLSQQMGNLTRGIIHGDYYRRNLLVKNGQITGLIDWDDAHTDYLMQEVAWSTWEFCKNSDGTDLHLERARAFLHAYQRASGPCQPDEYTQLMPFMRWRLRDDIRYNLAAAAAGQDWSDPDYVKRELQAFARLSIKTLL